MLKLACKKGPFSAIDIELIDGQRYVLGREPQLESAQRIELPSQTVSGNHVELYQAGSSWLIKDLQSTNGIRINRQRVREAYLSEGDLIDIGEFQFLVEKAHEQAWDIPEEVEGGSDFDHSNEHAIEPHSSRQTSESPSANHKKLIDNLKIWFDKIDFSKKMIGGSILFGLFAHLIISTPYIQESKKRLFSESIQSGHLIAMNLAQRYQNEMAQEQFHLIDCDVYREQLLRNNFKVISAYVINLKAEVVCPLGLGLITDQVFQSALSQSKVSSNCSKLVESSEESSCSIVAPIRSKKNTDGVVKTVGFARLEYVPQDAYYAVKKMQSLRWQTFFAVIIIFGVFGYILQFWLNRSLMGLTDQVHLLFTGTAQKVDKIHNFSSLNDLIEEINRLNSKVNQGLSSDASQSGSEASFLQPLLQQVFLIEERAILAVDHENIILGMTNSLPELIPLQESALDSHITEAVADTHLQGELMGFLNDLGISGEILDRPLSLSDRVIQARGLPLYLGENYVASLIFFD